MRRARRLGHSGSEFGSSGEDSFVAVVVTKLTGALLFILLLTMVIMALLPKAIDLPPAAESTPSEAGKLTITTPDALPEAIAGRPYTLALAATGGQGPLRWGVDGPIPEGLSFDPSTARIQGTPKAGTPQPITLALRVTDGHDRATQATRLVVYETERPLTTPSAWKPGLPPIPWRAWLEQGFGFLVLALVHAVGMNVVGALERWSGAAIDPDSATAADDARAQRSRFAAYRAIVRLASLAAAAGLAFWLWSQRG